MFHHFQITKTHKLMRVGGKWPVITRSEASVRKKESTSNGQRGDRIPTQAPGDSNQLMREIDDRGSAEQDACAETTNVGKATVAQEIQRRTLSMRLG